MKLICNLKPACIHKADNSPLDNLPSLGILMDIPPSLVFIYKLDIPPSLVFIYKVDIGLIPWDDTIKFKTK